MIDFAWACYLPETMMLQIERFRRTASGLEFHLAVFVPFFEFPFRRHVCSVV